MANPVLIVGSIALDDVRTPHGEVRNAMGGSAVYASLAAAYFTRPGVVGVVGRDYPKEYIGRLEQAGVDTSGLEGQDGQTFHWSGYYTDDMSSAHSLETHLNVFAEFMPKIPATARSAPYVFLANIDPDLQRLVLDSVSKPKLVMLDTMNYWIEKKKPALLDVISRVNLIVLNDAETRQLTGFSNLIRAARWLSDLGPQGVIIKKGEHGALLFWEGEWVSLPAIPLESVKDPTGAGDTFAGGFIGALAKLDDLSLSALRLSAALGTVMASFVVEDFSVGKLTNLSREEIRQRHDRLRQLTIFEALPEAWWAGR
jgi:sugar/nucleoside kinase (ribokinase family)